MVFNGLLAYPFHPALRRFRPIDRPRLEDLRVAIAADHPLYAGVEAADLDLSPGRGGILRPRREPAAAGGADPGDPGAGSGAGRLAVAPRRRAAAC